MDNVNSILSILFLVLLLASAGFVSSESIGEESEEESEEDGLRPKENLAESTVQEIDNDLYPSKYIIPP